MDTELMMMMKVIGGGGGGAPGAGAPEGGGVCVSGGVYPDGAAGEGLVSDVPKSLVNSPGSELPGA